MTLINSLLMFAQQTATESGAAPPPAASAPSPSAADQAEAFLAPTHRFPGMARVEQSVVPE